MNHSACRFFYDTQHFLVFIVTPIWPASLETDVTSKERNSLGWGELKISVEVSISPLSRTRTVSMLHFCRKSNFATFENQISSTCFLSPFEFSRCFEHSRHDNKEKKCSAFRHSFQRPCLSVGHGFGGPLSHTSSQPLEAWKQHRLLVIVEQQWRLCVQPSIHLITLFCFPKLSLPRLSCS